MRSDEILRILSSSGPGYGSLRLKDGRIDRSPLPGLLENGQRSGRRTVPRVSERQLLGRSFWQDGFGTEVLPQRHSESRFRSSWTMTRSIPVETVNSWTMPSFYREENTTCTEASYSCMATKGACKDSSCTADIVL